MKRSILIRTTWKSQWKDGENGFQWKHRYLEEQRSRALDFLFDVSKRQPIHESIRDYHSKTWAETSPVHAMRDSLSHYDPDLDEQQLRAGALGDFYTKNILENEEHQKYLPEKDVEDVLSKSIRAQQLHERLRMDEDRSQSCCYTDSCGAEDIVDTVSHLSKEDMDLLIDEFYPKTNHSRAYSNDLMKDVMRCRKTMSPKLSYAKIPQQERTTWSPWYLRHLTKND